MHICFGPAILLLGIYLYLYLGLIEYSHDVLVFKNIHNDVHCSIVCSIQILETT